MTGAPDRLRLCDAAVVGRDERLGRTGNRRSTGVGARPEVELDTEIERSDLVDMPAGGLCAGRPCDRSLEVGLGAVNVNLRGTVVSTGPDSRVVSCATDACCASGRTLRAAIPGVGRDGGSTSTLTIAAGRMKRPCFGAHSKYRSPFAEPSFLPIGLSNSTPT